MRDKGGIPCTYTADLGQYDELDIAGVPARAKQYGAEIARAVDIKPQLVAEGLAALACGAFHIRSGGRTYFNTTPLGRAVTGHAAGAGDAGRRREHLGRRLDLQGQRHRALLPLRADGQPRAAHLQAVARRRLRPGAGRARRDEQVAHRPRAAVPRLGREGVLHRRQHLGRHPRGQDPRAPRRVPRDRRADHGREVLGPRRSRSRPRTSRSPSRPGIRWRSTASGSPTTSPSCWRPTRSAAATAWACPTRSRTGSSRPSRAASTRHPAWRCSSPPTSDCSTRSTTRTRWPTTTPSGRKLGRLLYEGRWLDPQALMVRESIQRWVASLVTGTVTLRLRRGDDYTILDTTGPRASPTTRTGSPWSASRTPPSGPTDRIGQLTMRNLDIADSRAKLEAYAGQPMEQGTVLVEHGTLFGELPSGGFDQIADGRRRPRGVLRRRRARRGHRLMAALWGGRFASADPPTRWPRCRSPRTSTGGSRPTTCAARWRTRGCCTGRACSPTPSSPACSTRWPSSAPTSSPARSRPRPTTRTCTRRWSAG